MPKIQVNKVYHEIESAYKAGYTTVSEQGSSRCFAPGTLVRMYDGSLKCVEDITVGDKLMNISGDGYNTVMETHSGIDNMYRVKQARGIDYVVNSKHILAMRQTRAKQHKVAIPGYKSAEKRKLEMLPYDRNIIHDFPVEWYMSQSENFRKRYTCFKKNLVQLPEINTTVDPYYFGLWIGDGLAKKYYAIANIDKEVLDYFYAFAESLGTTAYTKDGVTHLMKVSTKRLCVPLNEKIGAIKKYFYSNNLICNKYVPKEYIYNSYENRLKFLAGLIDSDGCVTSRNTISITQKKREILEAVLEICRLSGFYTNGITEKTARMKRKDGSIYECKVYIIEINHNNFSDLNKYILCDRKRIKGKQCDRDYFVSSVKIESVGLGEYYGFTLDNSPYFLLEDGTVCHNSGKTFNTTIWLIVFLMMHPGLLLSVVRKTLPALKGSVLRDFKENLLNMGIWNDKSFNKSELIYTLPNGSQIEFFSTDDEQKIRGRKRHILYANEANELAEIEWQQLKMRTTMFSIMDYNPSFSEEHWINAVNADPRTYHFITTYKDNPFLEQTVTDEIESLKYKNKTLWQVYGLGLRAIVEGLVFKEFEIVDEVPEYARKKRWRGIDFGYSCFKGDTLITTARGDMPIKDVKAGDYVLTRKGYRRVKRNIYNGIRMVIEKELITDSHSSIINATYEHKFNANGKWKKYGELTQKDNLFVLLPLMGKSIEDTQTVNTQTTTITSGKETESSTQSYCITQCTNTSMGAYQRVRLFITKILTHLTIALKTLWQYPRLNTPKSIATWRNGRKSTARKCRGADIREIIGSRDEKRSYQNLQLQKDNATGAENSLCRLTHIKDSAQRSATIDGNIKHRKTTLNLPANGAERHSGATSISNQRPAAASVLIKCQELLEVRTGKKEWCKVYDLEIEGVHEYFANGFLVHNCDPTAIIDVYPYQDILYLDEICYRTEMLTSDIVQVLKANDPLVETISESADPRLVQEIYRAGVNIHPVHKFPGSIEAGITKMLEYKLVVTKRSINLIKELRNYTYAQDKEGKWLNKPIDAFNHCFTGDTLITTNKGDVPIKDIKKGDTILTSSGWQSANKLFANGYKKVLDVTLVFLNFRVTIKATPEHLFKTTNGWKKLEHLTKGDVLFALSNSKENDIPTQKYARTIAKSEDNIIRYSEIYTNQFMGLSQQEPLTMPKTEIMPMSPLKTLQQNASAEENVRIEPSLMGKLITCIRTRSITLKATKGSMSRSGSSITEKFLSAAKFITKTLIRRIMIFQTLNASLLKNTKRDIENGQVFEGEAKVNSSTLKQSEKKLKSGTKAKKVGNGILNTESEPFSKKRLSSLNAKFAEKNTIQHSTEHDSVQISARQSTAGSQELIMKSDCVSAVEENLQLTSIQNPPFAQPLVLQDIIVNREETQQVYDIEVNNTHEYFANGVLVHNCTDAIRYVVIMKILGGKPRPVNLSKIANKAY